MDQELRATISFVCIPRSLLHWYSSVQLFPFDICAGGGQTTSEFKQCMTVWESPACPTATGVWSKFKERWWDPSCQQKLCLQTDISSGRKAKEGNNPSQTTHCLNSMNLKSPATAKNASSCSIHYNIHTDDAVISVLVTVLFPADHFSCAATSKPRPVSRP